MECFSHNSDELQDRIDPFFYRPEFIKLENKIKKKSKLKMEDFILNIAGGATPNKNKKEKYYSDSVNGIPFLRVQNVTSQGLDLTNCEFIKKETHDGMLKRSQVGPFNLLTKITGVGRMAISSIAPDKFEGNINQHLVVIKTKDLKTSKVLAAFLNSDIGERLAFRRSTGGTRPALDYDALKSIPIVVEPKIVRILEPLYDEKKKIEIEVQKILNSINEFILEELGIRLPKIKDETCYVVTIENLENKRFDPRYYKQFFTKFDELLNQRTDIQTINDISDDVGSGSTPRAGGKSYTTKEKGVPFIRIVNISQWKINLDKVLYIKPEIHNGKLKSSQLKPNDVLLSIAGTIGLSVVVPIDLGEANINQALARIQLKDGLNPNYISAVLNSEIGKIQTERLSRPSVQSNLNLPEIRSIKIPIPKEGIQNKIADEVSNRVKKSEKLILDIKEKIEKAKLQVEKIILN